jgi:hypothetical protein
MTFLRDTARLLLGLAALGAPVLFWQKQAFA